MKASSITPSDSKSTDFVTTKNLFRPSSMVFTLAAFIIGIAKNVEGAIQAFIFDRVAENGLGRVMVLPASEDIDVVNGGSTNVPFFVMTGKKGAETNAIRWGTSGVTADEIGTAYAGVVTGFLSDITSSFVDGFSASSSVEDAVRDAIFPDLAMLAPRTGLERILDLMIPIRGSAANRLLVHVVQSETEVVVKFYDAFPDAFTDLVADVVTADKHIVDCEMKMPETAAVTASTPKLALE